MIARPAALALLLSGIAAPLPAQEPAWETLRIDLDVRLHPDAERLDGDAILRLRPGGGAASELLLRVGEAIAIRGVDPGGTGPPFAVAIDSAGSGATLRFERPVATGEEVAVEVAFASTGRGFQMVVDSTAAFASWARTWYPIAETYAAQGMTRIAMPAAWRGVASGGLVERTETDGRAVETWESERPLARSFAAGPYTVATREIGGRTIGTYLLTRIERADEFAAALAAVMDALEARFGPYPYAGYALAEVPEGLARWTGSSEQGFFMARSDALEGPVNLPLLAHELAHGWWGNWVRSVMPGSLMTGEALAQYAAVIAIEALEGEAAAVEFLRFSREGYSRIQSAKGFWMLKLAGHDRPLAELTGDGQDHNLADAKGHWVYAMLRRRLGDERFFGALRGVLADHGGGTLSLPELRRAFLAAAPDDEGLEAFLAQWLDRPGAPLLSTSWEDASADGRYAAAVTIRQRTPEPYRITVPIGVESAAGVRVHEVEVSEATTRVELAADGPPTGIIENVGHGILMWESAYCPE
ncbi:MAG TPA: M1 family aminopeptidase [Gemmatimonadota bacterium]|nr:M1 family aminopeptidase [Gemmatimonadota bacterium]